MAYIIVVDGGGSKTKGRSYNLSGRMIRESIEGFSNPMVDLELSVDHIVKVLKQLTSESPPEAVILGIAGSAHPSVHTLLENRIQLQIRSFLKAVQIILVDDLTLSYYAVFRGRDGVLGLLGTGSALLTRVEDEWLRLGGYGHILGDEGSGYVLAVETVKEAIHRAYKGDYTLSDRIVEYFGLETLEDIKAIVYRSPKTKLASLSKKVFEWEADEALTPIIENQIEAFSTLVMTLLRRVYSTGTGVSGNVFKADKVQLSLIGGMVQNNSLYFKRIEARIQTLIGLDAELNMICPEVDACEGGLHLYNEYIWRI
ncbi:N-acetylglucosamine kinase [Fusibacter sp. 3D3]|uniref:N-acetylglucosamine kinase n=1 Tax=Fusibacter sp. 3D3 TaxID=1048380 RepID=UPI0008531CDC|nr:hypothetical protein [Fusibacter sp. 3D3]GAU75937.1 kinase similar to eukaryotic-like N-acetylglucosamine kinase [Fusibacter sp. 3D3]